MREPTRKTTHCRARDPQQSRRRALIAPDALECLGRRSILDLFHRRKRKGEADLPPRRALPWPGAVRPVHLDGIQERLERHDAVSVPRHRIEDHRLQLADISGEVVVRQIHEQLGRDDRPFFAKVFRSQGDESIDQEWQVAESFLKEKGILR